MPVGGDFVGLGEMQTEVNLRTQAALLCEALREREGGRHQTRDCVRGHYDALSSGLGERDTKVNLPTYWGERERERGGRGLGGWGPWSWG